MLIVPAASKASVPFVVVMRTLSNAPPRAIYPVTVPPVVPASDLTIVPEAIQVLEVCNVTTSRTH